MTDIITQPRTAPLTPSVAVGRHAVMRLLPEYDELAERSGLPVTARSAWLRATLEASGERAPWAAVVHDRAGALRGAVVLDHQVDDGPARVIMAGSGDGHRGGIAALSHEDAHLIGRTVVAHLAHRAPGHALDLGALPDDERTAGLAAGLSAQLAPGVPVPVLRRDRGPDVAAYLSAGMRKNLRKARNRLATDGLTLAVTTTDDPDAVLRSMPFMESAYRDRDVEHQLPCQLDSSRGMELWRGRIEHLLTIGVLELTTLTLGSRPVAYVVGVRDGRRYSVLEGRFSTAWSRYAPGRLVEAAVLQRVLADERLDEVDWMTGVAPESLIAENVRETTVRLLLTPQGPTSG